MASPFMEFAHVCFKILESQVATLPQLLQKSLLSFSRKGLPAGVLMLQSFKKCKVFKPCVSAVSLVMCHDTKNQPAMMQRH